MASEGVKVDLTPIILAALPLARDMVNLVIDAVQSMKKEDVTPEQIDSMLVEVKRKNSEVQRLVDEIMLSRSA